MPKLVGSSQTVVDHGGIVIDELVGNVACTVGEDTLSVAYVSVDKAPCAEPWLTLEYDEWMCVRTGQMVLEHYNDDGELQKLTVNAGETVFIGKGERFRPVFPIAPTEYIPICTPAFRPDRCHREDEGVDGKDGPSDVSKKLMKLHGMEDKCVGEEKKSDDDQFDEDVLYHMCEKDDWDAAFNNGTAYFPPTFVVDGNYTHATAVPERLIHTANHYYKSSKKEWICLRLSRSALLKKCGIVTTDEKGFPVGDQAISEQMEDWICPHIYGGIPTTCVDGVLTKVYPMSRDASTGEFLQIDGLTIR